MDTKETRRREESRPAAANRPRTANAGSAQRPRSTDAAQRIRTGETAQRPRRSEDAQQRATAGTAQRTRRPATQSRTAATRRRTPGARRRPTQPQPSQDVVYTQPGPFNKGRFVLGLLVVGAVVLALIFGMSIFFKVDADKIMVSGADKYSAWQIREASGIKDGENLLSISEPRIANNIQSALPYVYKVRVGIKLPDTVKIEIVEQEVVYAIESADGSWWLMRSDGVLVEKTNDADAGQHTKLLGVQIADPAQGQKAVAAQPTPVVDAETEEETVPVTVLPQEQLSIATSVVQYLEDNGIIGEVTSLDVTNLSDLQIWYGDRYQVLLGDTLELSYKIRTMKSTMEQMDGFQGGVLDISFTTWPNEVGYTPFS